MARVIRRRGPAIATRQRRSTVWLTSADATAFTALAAGAAAVDQTFTEAQLLDYAPATIVRTRGVLLVKSDQEAAAEEPYGALGLTVISEQARLQGISAQPSPIADQASELFFVWVPFGVSGGQIEGQPVSVFQIDSKAMRKVEGGMAISVTIENGSSVHGLEYMIMFRMLLKVN